MSIYATLWQLKFPRDGYDYLGCEWITVIAQGVPHPTLAPRPRDAEYLTPGGRRRILFEDGTVKEIDV